MASSGSSNPPDRSGSTQDIRLLSPRQELPDRTASIFPYPYFNAVQSKCFHTIFHTNQNFVCSAPTGSGKTALLELAICAFVARTSPSDIHKYKIVYQAPTKALCSERSRDWKPKLAHLDLKVEELTGDTEAASLSHVRNADIIVTTPEKWDSMTRKWKDHGRLMALIRLFLIDEVHILKEDRGACLEAVVSRMKSTGNDIRYLALSATVPNSSDIAVWLGRDSRHPELPAALETFGERFRPVTLQKHVYGFSTNGNDFQLDRSMTSKLPEIISHHSENKPVMVFCITRQSAVDTAKSLAEWWYNCPATERCWAGPQLNLASPDPHLSHCLGAGVAFHHAGIGIQERLAIEKAYLDGCINVICCTSTLAVGINLPCHFVIIKNTVTYSDEVRGCKEYSDLDVIQMLGRAGRPQFDQSAVAVIMTRPEKVAKYEKLVQGGELLESRLHLNLIEHLNAELVLGTIYNLETAENWLKGTFLFVRLGRNPSHYKLGDDLPTADPSEKVQQICRRDLAALQDLDLVVGNIAMRSTEIGDAMARYCVAYETMKIFSRLQPKAKTSEILSAIAQATEMKSIRFRQGERATFKEINASPMMKFPIKVNLDFSAHKVSLIIQAVLGGVDQIHKAKGLASDIEFVCQNASRLVRCIVDCQLHLGDAECARHAMELARSISARAWDDTPHHLLQLDQIGPVAVRKLVGAGIASVDDLESTEAHRIDMVLTRNPPFGAKLLAQAKCFPKLRVSLKTTGRPMRSPIDGVDIKVKADIGFLNESSPVSFSKKAVNVCLLVETSDGRVAHFCRINGRKIGPGQELSFTTKLFDRQTLINAYISCDEIAGTLKMATLDPKISESIFESLLAGDQRPSSRQTATTTNNRARSQSVQGKKKQIDDYSDDEIGDKDLMAAVAEADYEHIDTISSEGDMEERQGHRANAGKPRSTIGLSLAGGTKKPREATSTPAGQRPDGKWECGHRCKDKTSCKHLCCLQGLDQKPRASKKKVETISGRARQASSVDSEGLLPPSTIMQSFLKRTKPGSGNIGANNLAAGRKHEAVENRNVLIFKDRVADGGALGREKTPASSSEDFGEDLFSGVDMSRLGSRHSNGERGKSLFLNDTSSPEMNRIQQTMGLREMNFAKEGSLANSATKADRQAIKSKKRKFMEEIKPVREQVATLGEWKVVAPVDCSAKESITKEQGGEQSQPWSVETDDLFGYGRKAYDTGPATKSKASEEFDDYNADDAFPSSDMLFDVEKDMSADGASTFETGADRPVDGQHVEDLQREGSIQACSDGEKVVPEFAEIAEGQMPMEQEKIDEWLRKEFEPYVNFI